MSPHGTSGDNMNYPDDRWRNWLSQLKGPGVKGIVFDTWNGYTEGYAAAPTREHGDTVYRWLTDLFEPLFWDCSHMHYVNGAPTWRILGAICEKWVQLGADRSFGAPVSRELPTLHGRVQHFTDGKSNPISSNLRNAIHQINRRSAVGLSLRLEMPPVQLCKVGLALRDCDLSLRWPFQRIGRWVQ